MPDDVEHGERVGFDRIAAWKVFGQRHLIPRVAEIVRRAIACNRRDPAAKCRRLAQLADARERRDEHLLHQVVQVSPRHPSEQDRVHHAHVAGVQPRAGVLVAGRNGANRLAEGLAARGGGRRGHRHDASQLEHVLHSRPVDQKTACRRGC